MLVLLSVEIEISGFLGVYIGEVVIYIWGFGLGEVERVIRKVGVGIFKLRVKE